MKKIAIRKFGEVFCAMDPIVILEEAQLCGDNSWFIVFRVVCTLVIVRGLAFFRSESLIFCREVGR